MSIFQKRDDVLDLTQLKKRGLIKDEQKTNSPQQAPQNSSDYFDLSSLNKSQVQETPKIQEQQTDSSPLSFFNNFSANAAQISNECPAQKIPSQNESSELMIKIENLEYQLERLTEKLSMIEDKILKFEEKVSD